MINKRLNELAQYALNHQLMQPMDFDYAINSALYLLKLDSFAYETVEEEPDFFLIIEEILQYAGEQNLIDVTSIADCDNFESKLVDCFMMRPAELDARFHQLYQDNPIMATNWFYDLSIHSNYIKSERIKKNITYQYFGKYAPLDITINLSKPEKDPKKIALQKEGSDGYPACALCVENVGYYGTDSKAARSNHRVISLSLNGEENAWAFQYSPYSYFNEHCIVLSKAHVPMKVDFDTFCELMDFIIQFPHYIIGSNAGLPIVGGSILSHYHFQGGKYTFPIEHAHVIKAFRKRKVTVELLDWPLSVVRVVGTDPRAVIDMVNQLFENWKEYTNEELFIFSETEGEKHNTITPILRYSEGEYRFYVVFRNNIATKERPYGVFHPREEWFHIKKENIGLIEVMGLAVLPGRLQSELQLIKKCLIESLDPSDYSELEKHLPWIEELKTKSFDSDSIDSLLKDEVGIVFEKVLEDCGVFKEKDFDEFARFIEDTVRL